MVVPNWSPFCLAPAGQRPDIQRSLTSRDGIGDRLRSAAFAEIQAREAFLWAANCFKEDAPVELIKAWHWLAGEEDKHLNWLLKRLSELQIDVKARQVSDFLWHSFMECDSAKSFAHYMASAEERGRVAGEKFYSAILKVDPESARIFKTIAEEEVAHIRLAEVFFPR